MKCQLVILLRTKLVTITIMVRKGCYNTEANFRANTVKCAGGIFGPQRPTYLNFFTDHPPPHSLF